MGTVCLVLAFVLDVLLGDPGRTPHPVRLIGLVAARQEAWARTRAAWLSRKGGGVFAAVNAMGFGALAHGAAMLPGAWGVAAWVYLAYAGLGLGQLVRESRAVRRGLRADGLKEARPRLAMLVSRDTAVLDARGVRRALAETVSENFNDGFLAPLFFLVLGGPGLLWAYKAISTMDSMWGYRTAAYRELGWAPARADDVLAWIPARLSALFLAAGGLVLGLKWRGALAKTAVQAQEMDSPNAGWPMAAAAWLLGAGMGGPTSYSGTMKPKPWLGPAPGEWTDAKLACLERLCLVSALLAVLLFAVLTGLVRMSLI